MFNLDINFLNDRPDLKPGKATSLGRERSTIPSGSKTPLYAGIAAALAFLGLVGGAFAYFSWQKGNLQTEQADLDQRLGGLELKKKELAAANKKVADAESEIKALASVFNQIKPWSAMSQDLRDRLPQGVQISSITQAPANGAAAATTGPAAVYVPDVVITGFANDYDQVNDFLVVLQKSNFLKPENTKIVKAERTEAKALQTLSLPVTQTGGSTGQPLKLPGKIEFSI